MITVKIGEEERTWTKYEADWVNQSVNGRKIAGESLCVRVTITIRGINLILSTPNCQKSGSGGVPLTSDDKWVIELWNRCGLSTLDFTGGNLVSFLKQVEHQF